MCMMSPSAIMGIIPAVVLLAVSFFVLVVVKKTEGSALKAFGYAVAIFLWGAAVVICSISLNALSGGPRGGMMSGCPMAEMMRTGAKLRSGMPMMQGTHKQMPSGEMKQRLMQQPMPGSPAQEDSAQ